MSRQNGNNLSRCNGSNLSRRNGNNLTRHNGNKLSRRNGNNLTRHNGNKLSRRNGNNLSSRNGDTPNQRLYDLLETADRTLVLLQHPGECHHFCWEHFTGLDLSRYKVCQVRALSLIDGRKEL